MALPDIDFDAIRDHHGSKADAFEELCCQLAADDPAPTRARFDRKGRGGDAGVECFETLADSSEIGWQVKYYSDIGSMLSSLDGSLDKALEKHPRMTRFIACFPFDLADARKEGTTSALTKWNEWRKARISAAASQGRTIEIERWAAHEIKQRLTSDNPRAAGRIAFWFDRELLTQEWLNGAFERTEAGLGKRYDPESHVDLPIRRAILATTLDPSFFQELDTIAEMVSSAVPRAAAGGAQARASCEAAVDLIRKAAAHVSDWSAEQLGQALSGAAEAVLGWHREAAEASETGRPSDDARAIANLLGRLRDASTRLHQRHWDLLGSKSLLVTGDAGSGKSHLVADACAHQLAEGRPALMVLGGKLADAEPWGEILRDLDLPRHLQVRQLLGALNAAGEAAGVRTLIALDALNEKNGQAIWPERLSGLLHDIEQFPWIAIVLSCRTTYIDVVIPEALDEAKLPRIEHRGFSIEAVRRYLCKRGVTLPEGPLQAHELRIPLFLRIYCDALEMEGEALLARGLGSLTDVFRAYSKAVIRKVHATMGIVPSRRTAQRALSALAREMADTGRGEVPYERADQIIREIHAGHDLRQDLLFQLQNEGLLATEPMYERGSEPVDVVRFTFERMGDHAIANDLIERSASHGVAQLCASGTPLHTALQGTGYILGGLLEALSIQLPERFGVELADVPNVGNRYHLNYPFRDSLLTRRLDAVTNRTWELVEKAGGRSLRYATLIALATEPGTPYNARHLDAELRSMLMPERDASWSAYIATDEHEDEGAQHLVDWVRSADQRAITAERAELAAIQLAWFLTTTKRPLRDKATKALVALLAERPALAVAIWSAFADVDDGYVTERVAAALYGAAMQGRWTGAELREVAEMLRAQLFADGSPPANVLLRDHAAGLIRYAAMRGVLPEGFDLASTQPPYSSPWPIEHISDATIAGFTRAYGAEGQRYPDEIVGSCDDGDFARYVLDFAVQKWSSAPRGTHPLPTYADLREQWLKDFEQKASPEMLQAHEAIVSATTRVEGGGLVYGKDKQELDSVKSHFREVVGPEIFEDWRARAEYWRADGMYQSFARRGPAEFNLAWARRWVTWRAHDIGWSEALHGAFDRGVRGDRHDHSVERIGKKYQWLALYELVARMGDNLEPLPDEREDGPERLRNLDPSMLRESTEDDGWRRFDQPSFWVVPSPSIDVASPEEALAWLHSGDDILDGAENVEVADEIEQHWLVLSGFESWRGGPEHARAEAWRRIGCTVVRARDRGRLLSMLSGLQMTENHAMPITSGSGFHTHLGEHPWAWPSPDEPDGWIESWRPRGLPWTTQGLPVRPPTGEYLAEAAGYDGSIEQNINLHLPAAWLMGGLGLRLSDGRSIEYTSSADEVLFMDPSVARSGRSAALIRRDAFLTLLKREDMVAIWAVAGEKNAYGDAHSGGFGGRHAYTRIFYSDGDHLVKLTRAERFEKPSRNQLAKFRGEELPEGADEDDLDIDDGCEAGES